MDSKVRLIHLFYELIVAFAKVAVALIVTAMSLLVLGIAGLFIEASYRLESDPQLLGVKIHFWQGWVVEITREDAMTINLVSNIAGSLIAALMLAGAGAVIGLFIARKRYEKNGEAAIASFSSELGKAIFTEPNDDTVTGRVAVARAVVSIRDSCRSTMAEFDKLLNSDIDALAELLRETEAYQRDNKLVPSNVANRIRETLSVLRLTWPTKKTQIDVAVRTMLAQLGLRQTH
jgi:uncharacterized protein YneF (UPF0154 family)